MTLKWKNGPMRSEGVRFIVDQVFHDECWDKFFAVNNGKRALPQGADEQRWPAYELGPRCAGVGPALSMMCLAHPAYRC